MSLSPPALGYSRSRSHAEGARGRWRDSESSHLKRNLVVLM